MLGFGQNMSHNPTTDIVPWVAHHVWEFLDWSVSSPVLFLLGSLSNHAAETAVQDKMKELEEEQEMDLSDLGPGVTWDDPVLVVQGWTRRPETEPKPLFCKKGRLNWYMGVWKKGDLVVGILNEASDSNAGGYDLAVVGETLEAVEEFLQDFDEFHGMGRTWGVKGVPIDEHDVITVWG